MITFDIDQKEGESFKFFMSTVDDNGLVTFDEPEADAGTVSLRIIDSDTLESIYKKTRKKVVEYVENKSRRAMERVVSYDQTPEQEKTERLLMWNHAITGWEGILDSKGTPIPCTPENKLKLMNNPYFGRFVNECLKRLSTATIERKEAEEKN